MGIYGILWVFKPGVNTYNLWFKLINSNNLFNRLLMFKLRKVCQINYKPGSVIKTYHFSRFEITFKLKRLTQVTSQGWLLVFNNVTST